MRIGGDQETDTATCRIDLPEGPVGPETGLSTVTAWMVGPPRRVPQRTQLAGCLGNGSANESRATRAKAGATRASRTTNAQVTDTASAYAALIIHWPWVRVSPAPPLRPVGGVRGLVRSVVVSSVGEDQSGRRGTEIGRAHV